MKKPFDTIVDNYQFFLREARSHLSVSAACLDRGAIDKAEFWLHQAELAEISAQAALMAQSAHENL